LGRKKKYTKVKRVINQSKVIACN